MKKKMNNAEVSLREQRSMICDNLGFAASEAYKLLRTNLMFSLPDENRCRVIGVTSAMRGEGKSTTSINLAYTIAESGKRTLLIDADMRLPTVAKRLSVYRKPGLSNVLVGMSKLEESIQPSGIFDNWYIMAAGDVPPNPSELLGSSQLERLLPKLMEKFDMIVFDLPPINIVSDALVLAPKIDGLVLVVRQGYATKGTIAEAMRQFTFQKAKLLGCVFTDVDTQKKSYGGRYGRYGSKYGYEHGYGYETEGYEASFSKNSGKSKRSKPEPEAKAEPAKTPEEKKEKPAERPAAPAPKKEVKRPEVRREAPKPAPEVKKPAVEPKKPAAPAAAPERRETVSPAQELKNLNIAAISAEKDAARNIDSEIESIKALIDD